MPQFRAEPSGHHSVPCGQQMKYKSFFFWQCTRKVYSQSNHDYTRKILKIKVSQNSLIYVSSSTSLSFQIFLYRYMPKFRYVLKSSNPSYYLACVCNKGQIYVFPRIWDEINNLLECQTISTFKSQILTTLLDKCKFAWLFVFFSRAALEKPTIFGHMNSFLSLRFLER